MRLAQENSRSGSTGSTAINGRQSRLTGRDKQIPIMQATFISAFEKCKQVTQGVPMLRLRRLERTTRLYVVAAVMMIGVAPGCAQTGKPTKMTPEKEQVRELLRQAVRRACYARHGLAKPEVEGALRLYSFWVEVTYDASPDRPPSEIRITEQEKGRTRPLYESREMDLFQYMLPLRASPDDALLATVWSTATTPVVRIFHIWNGKAKLVMYNASANGVPQFIVDDIPLVLLGRGREMHGNSILPTRTQIWQWGRAADEFVLRATVPYGLRWAKVAAMLQHGK